MIDVLQTAGLEVHICRFLELTLRLSGSEHLESISEHVYGQLMAKNDINHLYKQFASFVCSSDVRWIGISDDALPND